MPFFHGSLPRWSWLVATLLFACKPRTSTISPVSTPSTTPMRLQASDLVASPAVLLRGGRVMTAASVVYEHGDVLIRGGRISAVGAEIVAPANATIIDIAGKTLTPGIIDTHSHLGVGASPNLRAHDDVNERINPNTAYVRAADGYWPQDPQIDLARAGGVTAMQILPGSANLIGGRSFTVKLVPHARSAEDARFPGAPEGLKMACGENPKRVYGDKNGPHTRMGNVAGFRKAFQDAVEYRDKWNRYRDKRARWEAKQAKERSEDGKNKDGPPDPPSRNQALETLAGVLAGDILVHNHCYRADEMSIMLELAHEFGFHIRSFHHAVEAYKIADRLATAHTAASVWADWWGFKAESFDGVRANAALIANAGARAIIHSDSATGIQRLNQEAAKAMYAGRRAGIQVSEDEALRWITLNPAWALGVDHETGSVEPGKMADLVVWDGNPFSVYSKAVQVYIDGKLVYDRINSNAQPRTDFDVGFRASDYTTATSEHTGDTP